MVTSDGYVLSPGITVPPDTVSIHISEEGVVSVLQDGNLNAPAQVGQIQMFMFQNPAGLSADGNNIFLETAASGTNTAVTPGQLGAGRLAQGFLENSNVNMAEELVNLITAQRAFEVNSRAVRTADQNLQTAVNLGRG